MLNVTISEVNIDVETDSLQLQKIKNYIHSNLEGFLVGPIMNALQGVQVSSDILIDCLEIEILELNAQDDLKSLPQKIQWKVEELIVEKQFDFNHQDNSIQLESESENEKEYKYEDEEVEWDENLNTKGKSKGITLENTLLNIQSLNEAFSFLSLMTQKELTTFLKEKIKRFTSGEKGSIRDFRWLVLSKLGRQFLNDLLMEHYQTEIVEDIYVFLKVNKEKTIYFQLVYDQLFSFSNQNASFNFEISNPLKTLKWYEVVIIYHSSKELIAKDYFLIYHYVKHCHQLSSIFPQDILDKLIGDLMNINIGLLHTFIQILLNHHQEKKEQTLSIIQKSDVLGAQLQSKLMNWVKESVASKSIREFKTNNLFLDEINVLLKGNRLKSIYSEVQLFRQFKLIAKEKLQFVPWEKIAKCYDSQYSSFTSFELYILNQNLILETDEVIFLSKENVISEVTIFNFFDLLIQSKFDEVKSLIQTQIGNSKVKFIPFLQWMYKRYPKVLDNSFLNDLELSAHEKQEIIHQKDTNEQVDQLFTSWLKHQLQFPKHFFKTCIQNHVSELNKMVNELPEMSLLSNIKGNDLELWIEMNTKNKQHVYIKNLLVKNSLMDVFVFKDCLIGYLKLSTQKSEINYKELLQLLWKKHLWRKETGKVINFKKSIVEFFRLPEETIDSLFDHSASYSSTYQSKNGRQELAIENTGLCLLSPYIPHLFKSLDLIVNQQFEEEGNLKLAIQVLHYMATKKRNIQLDDNVIFLKLLTGCPIDQFLEFDEELPSSYVDEVEHLLEVVQQHWKVYKNKDNDGLRVMFLMRNARLNFGNEILIKVENSTYDILMNTLPWTYSRVHFPWMENSLRVEWGE
ncbi:contractile injection system tape measure protein [Flammeovirga pacifica]|uniref:Uncharacterized protein n=1 Tax=Flammeovirga pacifica TaxID=915059 RepID=A0A1S1YY85_FLAPC|nr:contractile injection system tape measure protein [Flammeovirga pacifica]OHX65971.1 hypothetical protein NH26_06210 [Flammeovirga pacifica]